MYYIIKTHLKLFHSRIIFILFITNASNSFCEEYAYITSYDNYITYRTLSSSIFDTLNRIDENGLKQGKWIEYDSTMIQNCNLQINCHREIDTSYSHTFKEICTDWFRVYIVKWSGLYINNKKQGIWINSYLNHNSNLYVFYLNGIIQSPIHEYLRGFLYRCYIFDKKRKRIKCKLFDEHGRVYYEFFVAHLDKIIDPEGYKIKKIK
jgi:hypothetical protein